MTRTYDPTVESNRNQVRELIGDADATRLILEDQLIDRYLTTYSNSVLPTAQRCARLLYAYLLRLPDRQIESMSVNRQRIMDYPKLIAMIDDLASAAGVTAFVGGASISEDQALLDNEDWRAHHFGVGWMDRDDGGQK